MKIKIGNKIFDSEKEPIMLILTEQDKNNIANMIGYKENKYCSYLNKGYTEEEILEFMKYEGINE